MSIGCSFIVMSFEMPRNGGKTVNTVNTCERYGVHRI